MSNKITLSSTTQYGCIDNTNNNNKTMHTAFLQYKEGKNHWTSEQINLQINQKRNVQKRGKVTDVHLAIRHGTREAGALELTGLKVVDSDP